LTDIMKIKPVINELYNKFSDGSTFKSANIKQSTYFQALLYLIRLYLLNLPEDNDNTLKISFVISNHLLRSQNEDDKYFLIPKFICMFD
jgi:hypothetical protein